jgi:MEMO1 family protein
MKRFALFLAFLLLLPAIGCSKEVRKPAVAGQFYPADPAKLREVVDGFVSASPKVDEKGQLLILFVPHAGYAFSGAVAGMGFKQLEGSGIRTVIMAGPSHYYGFRGASVSTVDSYATPLGDEPVDKRLARSLLDPKDLVVDDPKAHQKEHSLEVEVPFLQRVLPDAKVVPIVVGSPDKPMLDSLSAAIADRIEKDKGKTIMLVSSDWSHYHDYDTAVKMDSLGIETVKDLSSFELMARSQEGKIELCGIYPAMLAMDVAGRLGADSVKVFSYANSGDVTGDRSRVVGYAAIGIYRAGATKAPGLTESERKELLTIARNTLTDFVKTGKAPLANPVENGLNMRRGAFVTLKENGELRGCIGDFFSDSTLAETVRDMAINAAARDYRFTPVRPDELGKIKVEVSVLSPLRKISSVDEIKVGRDGLYIVKGLYRGVLLPQVPVEQGWDRNTFLEQTCRKAGLLPDAWKQGADLYTFTAEVFGEK